MAFHQIFISKSVQFLGLVLTDRDKKTKNKKQNKNKTNKNKTKQKTKNKQKNKAIQSFYFQNMSKSISCISFKILRLID